MDRPNSKQRDEKFTISFWGLKINCANPGKQSILILIIVFLFLLVIIIQLKPYIFALAAASKGKGILTRIIN